MNKTLKTVIISAVMMLASASVFAAKKTIVCTTYPEYDWVINVLGEKASGFDVTLLQNNGTDLHSYQPSVKDIAKISKADLFVYVGGESDEWVEKMISQSVNKKQIVVNMLEVLGDKVREEEIVEGMQVEEEEEHEHHHHDADAEHEHHHHHSDEEEVEYDEHVWLSLNNAIDISNALCEKICIIDPANSTVYEKNLSEYTKQLAALDSEYKAAVEAAKKNTVLFGDRFPFRYLTDDYGLKYFAAFVGCSAESEASFETIIFLAKKVDELGLNAVLTIEKSDKKIAKTVVGNTKNKNQEVLEMDSLQSITVKEIKGGRTYLSAMKKNLEVLKKALK
ncbi:MAG: zinc ABC transporter substrate-binding protein [Treponema sp.]|nr:zinc ABC transporter substrate-binding protein [Candidatus Treponema equifaecale]